MTDRVSEKNGARKQSCISTALSMLIGKLVGTVESVERLPQYLYDSPGGSPFGLQLLSRRLRLKLFYEQVHS